MNQPVSSPESIEDLFAAYRKASDEGNPVWLAEFGHRIKVSVRNSTLDSLKQRLQISESGDDCVGTDEIMRVIEEMQNER